MNPTVPSTWSTRFAAERESLQRISRWRTPRTVTARDGVRDLVDGTWRLNFCSNDYLGLAQHHGAVGQGGAGSAHLVCGHSIEHETLERKLCEWLDAPAAMLVGSGYLGNLAAITGLCGAQDRCVQDKLNHASLIDAAQLARCDFKRYPHNDIAALQRQLDQGTTGNTLVAVDGVFSMDGDVANLHGIREVLGDALLFVDEAHSIGVLGGAQGQGIARDHAHLRLVTFGKALGTYGAALLGDRELLDYLRQKARPTIFTTALPPGIAAQTAANIDTIRQGELVPRLMDNVVAFGNKAREHGLELIGGDSAIFAWVVGEDATAVQMAEQLWNQGIWVSAIRPPTVPMGSARLRITMSAMHTTADIDQLLRALVALRDG